MLLCQSHGHRAVRATATSIAATLATAFSGAALADFNDAVVVRYAVQAEEADGTAVSVMVEDLYLLTDDPKDVDLNIYDLILPADGRVPYFQSQTGPGWTPTNIGGPFDTSALRFADSFVTVGGMDFGTTAPPQSPGAGGATQIDPFFGGNDVAYPIDRAGWFNSSPPNLQGIAGQTPAGLGVMIGRFAYDGEFSIVGATLSATWNQGIGTTGTQASFVVREFVDCNGNIVEDAVEIADPLVSPYEGATPWTTADGGNGHWYAWVPEELTRAEAAAWAAARGGYLATFELDGELDFVLSLTSPFCCANYVGGTQLSPGLEPAGSWMWDTGQFIDDLGWAPMEPNDESLLTGGTERYLELYSSNVNFGTFNDASGEALRPFIVEWDAAADCNTNGILDCCEIVDGTDLDRNGNRIPDSCEALLVPEQYGTIQAAIDAVPEGGVVLVGPGTYQENINLRPTPKARQFVLVSTDGAKATRIEGVPGVQDTVVYAPFGLNDRSRIEGFTIAGGIYGHEIGSTEYLGGGMFVSNSSLAIWNCRFLGNEAQFGGNIYGLNYDGDIRDCVFSGGRASTDGGNVMVLNSNCVIAACDIVGGSVINDGGGIKIVRGFVDLLACDILSNSAQTGGGVTYTETPGQASELNFVASNVQFNNAVISGGGFWSLPDGSGPNLGTSVVCDNGPDNFFGPYTDLGDNEICVCIGDLNLDGVVDGVDLGLYLVYAGSDCEPGSNCPADLNGDGEISGADLGLLLLGWGVCP